MAVADRSKIILGIVLPSGFRRFRQQWNISLCCRFLRHHYQERPAHGCTSLARRILRPHIFRSTPPKHWQRPVRTFIRLYFKVDYMLISFWFIFASKSIFLRFLGGRKFVLHFLDFPNKLGWGSLWWNRRWPGDVGGWCILPFRNAPE